MLLSALTCQKSYLASTMNHEGNCVNIVSSEVVLRNRKQKYLRITCLCLAHYYSRAANVGFISAYKKRFCEAWRSCHLFFRWSRIDKQGFPVEFPVIPPPRTMVMCTSLMCMTWCVQDWLLSQPGQRETPATISQSWCERAQHWRLCVVVLGLKSAPVHQWSTSCLVKTAKKSWRRFQQLRCITKSG